MRNWVNNNIELDEKNIWRLSNGESINYSDGKISENYLTYVLGRAQDLSSLSQELESHIVDWASEYHLSRRRSLLLRALDYRESVSVLEVGCGCGAITRFLGETFDKVIAIEGSHQRARIARMRTRDLDNVSIICAPFQKVEFKKKFDLIFCIGVFEYSGAFVEDDDPYNTILEYFREILTENGAVIIAIENQFGLKYFASSTEDHNHIMFDGIEDYSHHKTRARTFGKHELSHMLHQHFSEVDFYYPYPDYKIATCLLSESFYTMADPTELLSGFIPRDYVKTTKKLFDQHFSIGALQRNGQLQFFSNSFLLVAGNTQKLPARMHDIATLYNMDRVDPYCTVTRFLVNPDHTIRVQKNPLLPHQDRPINQLTMVSTESQWTNTVSLHTQITQNIKDKSLTLQELFSPAKTWIRYLKDNCTVKNNVEQLDGRFIDCRWKNFYHANGENIFIDDEWIWHSSIPLKLVVIRSIYLYLIEIDQYSHLNPHLLRPRRKSLINEIAQAIGIELSETDYLDFYNIEPKLTHIARGKNILSSRVHIKLYLINRFIYYTFVNGIQFLQMRLRRIKLLHYVKERS